MNGTHDEANLYIQQITVGIYRFGFSFAFLLGIIGNMLCIRIFVQPIFLSNSCCNYFLASSSTSLIQLVFGVFIRLLYFGYQIDTKDSSYLWWCKTRVTIVYTSHLLSYGFISIAAFDRFASSSYRIQLRRFCHVHVARRIILLTTFLTILLNLHAPIQLTIEQNQCKTGVGWYSVFYDIFLLVIHSLFYPILSGSFTYLAIRNIHCCRLNGKSRTKTREFLLITLFQTICMIFLTTPFAVHKLYWTVTNSSRKKSLLRQQLEEFTMSVARLLWCFGDGTTFYLFTLSSVKFRNEFKKLLTHYWKSITRNWFNSPDSI